MGKMYGEIIAFIMVATAAISVIYIYPYYDAGYTECTKMMKAYDASTMINVIGACMKTGIYGIWDKIFALIIGEVGIFLFAKEIGKYWRETRG